MRLREDAYAFPIAEAIGEVRGRRVSLPAVHETLRRMTEKKYVTSKMLLPKDGSSTRKRRYYSVAGLGERAMRERENEVATIYEISMPEGVMA